MDIIKSSIDNEDYIEDRLELLRAAKYAAAAAATIAIGIGIAFLVRRLKDAKDLNGHLVKVDYRFSKDYDI
ncbi:MAG: hypothetical protein FWG30_06790 [Eubacteriaceae bacterium]|nr:hypothetical protein [Eubacteriaceae bacterium]